MRIHVSRSLRLWLPLLLAACAASRVGAAEPLDVYTVNYPLAYFAERIGGDRVRVSFPAPAEVDPAFWRPNADTIRRYQQADLVLLNGAGYARWVAHVSLPRRRSVDTSRAFRERWIETGVMTNE